MTLQLWRCRALPYLLAAYWLAWAYGLLTFAVPLRQGGAVSLFSAALYAALLPAVMLASIRDRRELLWLLVVAATGEAAEAFGLSSLAPFGHYSYTEIMVPQVHGLPLLIGLTWAEYAWYAWHLLDGLVFRLPARVVLGAAWLTAVDALIDPVGSGPLHCWVWHDKSLFAGVPLQNFIGWFVFSALVLAIGALLLRPSGAPQPQARTTAVSLGFSILLFYTLLALRFRLWPVAAIGGVLVCLHLLILRRRGAGST